MKADRFAFTAAGRAAFGRGLFEKQSACGPGSRSRPASPSSAATRSSSTPRPPTSAAARRSPTPAGCCPATSPRSCIRTHGDDRIAELAAARHRAGDQRAHRRLPPVPAPGRPAHRPGAPAAAPPGGPWRTSATRPTTWPTRTCSPGRPPGMHVRVAGPAGFEPDPGVLDRAGRSPPAPAARCGCSRPGRGGPRTPTWWPPTPGPRWARRTTGWTGSPRSCPYQVNAALLGRRPARARSCCTACRRTGARRSPTRCIDGPQSAVFDQAENRLHAQKALLAWLLEAVARCMTVPDPRRPGTPGSSTLIRDQGDPVADRAGRPARRRRHAGHPGHPVPGPGGAGRGQGPRRRRAAGYLIPEDGDGRCATAEAGTARLIRLLRELLTGVDCSAATSPCCAPRRAPRSSWPARSTGRACPTSSAPSPATTPSWSSPGRPPVAAGRSTQLAGGPPAAKPPTEAPRDGRSQLPIDNRRGGRTRQPGAIVQHCQNRGVDNLSLTETAPDPGAVGWPVRRRPRRGPGPAVRERAVRLAAGPYDLRGVPGARPGAGRRRAARPRRAGADPGRAGRPGVGLRLRAVPPDHRRRGRAHRAGAGPAGAARQRSAASCAPAGPATTRSPPTCGSTCATTPAGWPPGSWSWPTPWSSRPTGTSTRPRPG